MKTEETTLQTQKATNVMPAQVKKADFSFYYPDNAAMDILSGEVRTVSAQMVLSIRKGKTSLRDYLVVGKKTKDGALEGTNGDIHAIWNKLSDERYCGIWREDRYEYPFIIDIEED